jgi:hypothetical protein
MFSCTGTKFERQKVRTSVVSDGSHHTFKYKVNIPKNYTDTYLLTGNWEKEYQYWYKDSSVLYIVNNSGCSLLNFDNIFNEENAYNYSTNAFIQLDLDTATFQGVDKQGMHWKERRLNGFCIGYLNVSSTNQKDFDYALSSVKWR